jgi:signal transduction histidine kinase
MSGVDRDVRPLTRAPIPADTERVFSPLTPVALRRLGAAVGCVILAELAVTVLLGRGLGGPALVPYPDLVGDVAIVAAAGLLTAQRPTNPIGWLLATFAALGATQNLGSVYGVRALRFPGEHLIGGPLALSLGDSLWIPAMFVPLTLLPVLYPDGTLPAPWWRWVNRIATVGMVLATVVAATDTGSARDDIAGGRPIATLPHGIAMTLGVAAGVSLAGAAVLSIGGLLGRIWVAERPQRQQMLWLITTALIAVPALFVTQGHWLFALALALVPLAVAVGVLRYQLLGIEIAVRRILVYGLLTVIVVGIYGGVSAFVSAVVPTGPEPKVIAAAAVAIVLSPVRDRLQRMVDRLVYGARHDPLSAVREVGAHVATMIGDPLAGVVRAVADAIRSPVTIVDPTGTVLTTTGESTGRTVTRTLSVGGAPVGDLVIALPPGESGLGPADERMVDALAVPVAIVVHANRLNLDLTTARARLLEATAMERARFRADLHDGLGPSLSGVALGLQAVQQSVASRPDRAAVILARLHTEVGSAVEEVRRIIDALAPVALDGRSLDVAIRDRVTAASLASGLTFDVGVTALPELDAEVAAAAYRIADEAIANVLRHAQATHCVVRLSAAEDLRVEVHDDGRGYVAARPGGIGLASMRQRAERLGGYFEASGEGGGHVVVRLPL